MTGRRERKTQHPLVGFLEAAYAWDRDDGGWLRGVIRASHALVPTARLVCGVLHHVKPSGVPHIRRVSVLDGGAGSGHKRPLRILCDPRYREIYFRRRVALRPLRARRGSAEANEVAALNRAGVTALLTVNGSPRARAGCLLAFGVSSSWALTRKRSAVCEHVAEHLGRAHALRVHLEQSARGRASEGRADARAAAAGGVLAYREREIVLLAAAGKTSKVIAHELGIADTTVRVLLARAAMKLGVKRRHDLFAHPAVRALVAAADPT